MMGVSLRAYARMRGCSLTAVQKAIASKRITALPDGTLDPERANQEWAKNTFAGKTLHDAARSATTPARTPAHPSGPPPAEPNPASVPDDEDPQPLANAKPTATRVRIRTAGS